MQPKSLDKGKKATWDTHVESLLAAYNEYTRIISTGSNKSHGENYVKNFRAFRNRFFYTLDKGSNYLLPK